MEKVWELIAFIPIREASRIAFAADKDNSPHQRICKKPLRAAHTNDVMPLPITFAAWKLCENFTNEDNFNNTFALHYGGASAKVEKVFQIFASDS